MNRGSPSDKVLDRPGSDHRRLSTHGSVALKTSRRTDRAVQDALDLRSQARVEDMLIVQVPGSAYSQGPRALFTVLMVQAPGSMCDRGELNPGNDLGGVCGYP